MSLTSQSVENTKRPPCRRLRQLRKGQTHACTTMQNLIPAAYKLKGTVSDKALYYDDDLRPGTSSSSTTFSLPSISREVLKSATANFREPIEHRTLTTERASGLHHPERCVCGLRMSKTSATTR